MACIRRLPGVGRAFALAGILSAGAIAAAGLAAAQDFSALAAPETPLVLKSQGSFYVGGELIRSEALGTPDRSGNTMVHQMYVRFMVPQEASRIATVLVHGGGLSGKNYETQPDGRMGWDEYFVRKGSPTYIVDQAGRGRSSHDVTLFNRVRAGEVPPGELPAMFRTSNEFAWTAFRFGAAVGEPFPDTKFPVAALDEFAKQQVTTMNVMLPQPDPNFKALADLAGKLEGAILIGHSQSGRFPLEAALIDASGTKGLVLIEPAGGCNATRYTDEQVKAISAVPVLAVFGDHLTGTQWQNSYDDCMVLIDRLKAAGGAAQMLYPPDLGITGNSHMLMNDTNSDEIADLILKWVDETVR